MGLLDKFLGKEEKSKQERTDFSGQQEQNPGQLDQGFEQKWQMPEKPVFGDPSMDNNFDNYGNWDTGRSQSNDMSFGAQKFNENVEVRELNNQPHTQTQPTQNWSDKSITKDLEVISSKLDAIKSSVENLDHRIRNLERIAEGEQKPQKPWYGKNF